MATLVLLQGGQAIPYELGDDEAVLGRHPDCEIQLESNMVSRRHARVAAEGGQFFVEDLGSGNGTFVNGKQITERTALRHGDRLKLGPILLRFEHEQAAVSPASAKSAVAATDVFKLDVTSDEEDLSTIMSVAEKSSGFGVLDVQPETKLKAILEISRALAGTVELESLLPKILDMLFSVFPHADRGSALLKDAESGRMVPAAQKHRRKGEDETVKLSRTILKSRRSRPSRSRSTMWNQ